MAVTDAAGVVTARYRYRAFGERVTLSGGAPNRTDPSFQNRSFDAGLGIYDYRNRQFDPATGRFLRKSRWG
jgi:RHS repeat-associated protein